MSRFEISFSCRTIQFVLWRVHPGMLINESASNAAVKHITVLAERLADLAVKQSMSIEDAVRTMFPSELADFGIRECKKAISLDKQDKGANLTLSVGTSYEILRARGAAALVDPSAPVALTAVVEYIATEVLELAGNVVAQHGHDLVTADDMTYAIQRDKELNELLFH